MADSGSSLGSLFAAAWAISRKDVVIELRSREIVYLTLFFAVSCVLVFAFSFVRDGRAPEESGPAILWIAVAFAGTLALNRTFERERASATLPVLLLAPCERPAIYLGKLMALLLLMGAVEVVLVPLVSLMFGAPFFEHPLGMVLLLGLGTLGFAAVGTLFAAMLGRAHSREALLPILLYPMTVPVMIAGVRGTASLLEGAEGAALVRAWIGMLVFFDVVFLTLALWTFEAVMTE